MNNSPRNSRLPPPLPQAEVDKLAAEDKGTKPPRLAEIYADDYEDDEDDFATGATIVGKRDDLFPPRPQADSVFLADGSPESLSNPDDPNAVNNRGIEVALTIQSLAQEAKVAINRAEGKAMLPTQTDLSQEAQAAQNIRAEAPTLLDPQEAQGARRLGTAQTVMAKPSSTPPPAPESPRWLKIEEGKEVTSKRARVHRLAGEPEDEPIFRTLPVLIVVKTSNPKRYKPGIIIPFFEPGISVGTDYSNVYEILGDDMARHAMFIFEEKTGEVMVYQQNDTLSPNANAAAKKGIQIGGQAIAFKAQNKTRVIDRSHLELKDNNEVRIGGDRLRFETEHQFTRNALRQYAMAQLEEYLEVTILGNISKKVDLDDYDEDEEISADVSYAEQGIKYLKKIGIIDEQDIVNLSIKFQQVSLRKIRTHLETKQKNEGTNLLKRFLRGYEQAVNEDIPYNVELLERVIFLIEKDAINWVELPKPKAEIISALLEQIRHQFQKTLDKVAELNARIQEESKPLRLERIGAQTGLSKWGFAQGTTQAREKRKQALKQLRAEKLYEIAVLLGTRIASGSIEEAKDITGAEKSEIQKVIAVRQTLLKVTDRTTNTLDPLNKANTLIEAKKRLSDEKLYPEAVQLACMLAEQIKCFVYVAECFESLDRLLDAHLIKYDDLGKTQQEYEDWKVEQPNKTAQFRLQIEGREDFKQLRAEPTLPRVLGLWESLQAKKAALADAEEAALVSITFGFIKEAEKQIAQGINTDLNRQLIELVARRTKIQRGPMSVRHQPEHPSNQLAISVGTLLKQQEQAPWYDISGLSDAYDLLTNAREGTAYQQVFEAALEAHKAKIEALITEALDKGNLRTYDAALLVFEDLQKYSF